MATYLVMKNNIKRTFATKFTYLVMLLIPIAISFASIVSGSLSNSDIRVGVICNAEEFKEVSEAFSTYPEIRCEMEESESRHADLITGKYQYLVDMTEKSKNETTNDTKESISAIMAVAQESHEGNEEGLSKSDRTFALLLTSYMMIASIYAATIIKDKKNKTLERFCFAGFTKASYSLGYMASIALIMICQLSVAVLMITLLDHGFCVSFEKSAEMILFMAGVASVFGVGVASFFKSELSANITASSIVVILSLLGGTFVSIEQMPELLKCVSIISPIRWLQLLP